MNHHCQNQLSARGRRAVLAVMCLALMMVVAAVASLNVALPDLARSTGASQSQLQWIVDAYALVFAGLLLPAGALGDRYGRKGILQIGLAVFGIASLAAIFVNDPGWLIGLRAVIGVGAALVMPTTLSIITNVFPEDERGRAVGIWAGVAGAGATRACSPGAASPPGRCRSRFSSSPSSACCSSDCSTCSSCSATPRSRRERRSCRWRSCWC